MENVLVKAPRLEESYPEHRGLKTLDVVVYKDASGVHTVPDTTVVEHPDQTIVWTPVAGTIRSISFEGLPRQPEMNDHGKWSLQIPKGHRGAHKYEYKFVPEGEAEVAVDPIAEVEY